jgi:dipeptidyl aminopeptidase/acylaminoacyl peptidase
VPQGKAGLVVHLYGSGGSLRENGYNIGRPPYQKCRQLLAERGYWLVVPDLGPKHWMNEMACAQVDAVIAAMIELEQVDRERVHLLGTSMGAGSSLIYIMRRPERIKSVVAVFPMTDFSQWLVEQPRYRGPVEQAHKISPDQRVAALVELSPLRHPEAFRNLPVLLLHGDQDTVVPPHHSRDFAAALKERGSLVTYHEVPGLTHDDEIARPYQRELADFFTLGYEYNDSTATEKQ